jgi:uncharacterized membrane protein HdeD (DUF308 family)
MTELSTDAQRSSSPSRWWGTLIRGILAIVLGILLLTTPKLVIGLVALIFGLFAIVDGVIMIIVAIASRKEYKRWGLLLVQGLLALILGFAVLFFPAYAAGIGGLIVLWLFVFYGIVLGIAGIAAATEFSGSERAWGITAGVLAIIFGIVVAIFLILNPTGVLSIIIWIVAVWAIISGLILFFSSFGIRKREKSTS